MSKISCPTVASHPSIPFLSYDLYFSLDHICPLGPSHKAFTFLFHESQNRTWSYELPCVMPGRSSESEMKYKGDLDDYLFCLFRANNLSYVTSPALYEKTRKEDKEAVADAPVVPSGTVVKLSKVPLTSNSPKYGPPLTHNHNLPELLYPCLAPGARAPIFATN